MGKSENTETKILKLFGGNESKEFSFDKLKTLLPKTVRKEKLIHALLVLKKQKRIVETQMDVYKLNTPDSRPKSPKTTLMIKETPKNKIPAKTKNQIVQGTLDVASTGVIFVTIEGMERDAIIRTNAIPAISGDIIEVELYNIKEGKRPEANFIRVVERKHTKFLGKLTTQKSKEHEVYFVSPLSQKIMFDFYIASKHLKGAKDGDFVEVEFIDWKETEKNPRGLILEVLKNFNPNELEMRSILLDRGFQMDFPEPVKEELKKISKKIPEAEIKHRLDLREVMTITIDPKTARDFDDALSIQKVGDDRYELGVHIADVAYYVQAHSEIDKEAIRRATSVYLPDRVAPMLPELLSNELCSLNPKVDRLAFSVIYTIDSEGNILNESLAKTIIHSKKRFSYEDAQNIIESGTGELAKEVLFFWSIASKWRQQRFDKGAINFEAPEVQFVLDENQVPIKVVQKISKEANWLIEEFMLRANVTVAKTLDQYTKAKQIPAGIYRNHDVPDLTKLEQFRSAALRLGNHKVKKIEHIDKASKILNEFLKSIEGRPEAESLNQIAIRSMAKAYYSSINIGHYGLAYSHYSHFTSPIRRYPDLIAHRLLDDFIKKQKSSYTASQIEELAIHCSKQEKKATECEREGIKFKQMEYMSHRIGEEFIGLISGMNATGFWVELKENKCEGYVDLTKNLKEGFVFEPEKMILKGPISKTEFYMGQEVTIRIERVELAQKRCWFKLINY